MTWLSVCAYQSIYHLQGPDRDGGKSDDNDPVVHPLVRRKDGYNHTWVTKACLLRLTSHTSHPLQSGPSLWHQDACQSSYPTQLCSGVNQQVRWWAGEKIPTCIWSGFALDTHCHTHINTFDSIHQLIVHKLQSARQVCQSREHGVLMGWLTESGILLTFAFQDNIFWIRILYKKGNWAIRRVSGITWRWIYRLWFFIPCHEHVLPVNCP